MEARIESETFSLHQFFQRVWAISYRRRRVSIINPMFYVFETFYVIVRYFGKVPWSRLVAVRGCTCRWSTGDTIGSVWARCGIRGGCVCINTWCCSWLIVWLSLDYYSCSSTTWKNDEVNALLSLRASDNATPSSLTLSLLPGLCHRFSLVGTLDFTCSYCPADLVLLFTFAAAAVPLYNWREHQKIYTRSM